MKTALVAFLVLCLIPAAFSGPAESGRIYTEPDPTASGGIEGSLGTSLLIALAINHDHTRVYLGELNGDKSAFRFEHLPVGKYDILCITAQGVICEGIALGDPATGITGTSRSNLDTRIAVADAFFNRHTVHRIGVTGDNTFALVERIRDNPTLKQSGEKLDANIRRIEIIELARATDDWQMTRTRHIYRDPEPLRSAPAFFKHTQIPTLGNIRVVDTMKSLGVVPVPSNP